jgi:hypothetical protein
MKATAKHRRKAVAIVAAVKRIREIQAKQRRKKLH